MRIPNVSTQGILLAFLLFASAVFFGGRYGVQQINKALKGIFDTEIGSTEALICAMHGRKGRHLKEFTFIQETVIYRDGRRDTMLWYEAIRYPRDFRIDFGDPALGHANINRNDSIYVFRNGELVHHGQEIQEFLVLEGGVYYDSPDETLKRLKELGIDIAVFDRTQYHGRNTFILGARSGDTGKPQIWMDAKGFYVVRRFSRDKEGGLYEVRYSDFRKYNEHWLESYIEFYIGDSLIQTEAYREVDVAPSLSDEDFDPGAFGTTYWFQR